MAGGIIANYNTVATVGEATHILNCYDQTLCDLIMNCYYSYTWVASYVFYCVMTSTFLLYRSTTWWLATDELTTAHLSSSGCLPALYSHWTSGHETPKTPQCQNSHDVVQLLYGVVLILSSPWGALEYDIIYYIVS